MVLVLASLIGSVRDREGTEVETTERGGVESSVGVEGTWEVLSQLGITWEFQQTPRPAARLSDLPVWWARHQAEASGTEGVKASMCGKNGSSLPASERFQPGLKLLSIISDPQPMVYSV